MQPGAKGREIDLFDRTRRVQAVEVDLLNCIGPAAERQHKPEVELLAGLDEACIEELQATFTVGKYETGCSLARLDDVRHGLARKKVIHRRVDPGRPPRMEQLRGLRRGEVVRISHYGQIVQQSIARIFNTHPDGLDTLVGQRDTEVALTFIIGEYGCANRHRVLMRGHRT